MGSRSTMGRGKFGAKGRPIVKYRDLSMCGGNAAFHLSADISQKNMSKLHKIFCTCYLCCGSVLPCQQCNTLSISGFVDDVILAHNQRGEVDANTASTPRDSPGGSTRGEV